MEIIQKEVAHTARLEGVGYKRFVALGKRRNTPLPVLQWLRWQSERCKALVVFPQASSKRSTLRSTLLYAVMGSTVSRELNASAFQEKV